MAGATTVIIKPLVQEEPEEDKELQDELRTLVNKILGTDTKLIPSAIDMLSFLIRTSTTSMTSVPKPLKYLAPYYEKIKEAYDKIEDVHIKKKLADVISVLAMGPVGGDAARKNCDCLRFCLLGTMKNIGDWGHEYIRQLENEITEQWALCPNSVTTLLPLVKDIIMFDCTHHAEIQACDLLMEIDQLDLLSTNIDKATYPRICLYLASCTKYVDEIESQKLFNIVADIYLRYKEYPRALIIGLQLNDEAMIKKIFTECKDIPTLRQMAFILARHLYAVDLDDCIEDHDELMNIMSNSHLSSYFLALARELDIMEPKLPEEVYKTWLEPVPLRNQVLGENLDSARQNLASSFVNGFVNAGFGCDKLLTCEGGNKWIYRNKEHGMLSATAALGLLHLWDVDGGLTPIDKYLYTNDEQVKAGALLALGIVNSRVRNECDPALALLADYVTHSSQILKIGAIFGLGLAYAGSGREDILHLLIPAVETSAVPEVLSITSLSCGLVAIGTCNAEVINAILTKLVDSREAEMLKSPHMRLAVLGMGLCYLGRKDAIETTTVALEVFTDPFKTTSQTILNMCAYAGTGDVLVIQELLRIVGERIPVDEKHKTVSATKSQTHRDKKIKQVEWDASMPQAMATLAVAAVATGEETGMEMVQRIFGNIGRYGYPGVRRAVPLAAALTSVSRPSLPIIDLLTKYSHDSDDDMSCNAIFCLGIIGAGTNNARLAAGLRQLAVYHARNPAQLFMVRLSQGLTHLGKGTLTLNPLHTDRQLVDQCAMAGLLITLVALLEPSTLVLSRTHYLLYSLSTAMQPRWLLTLDENLELIPTTVRVGQAVDTVGKAGTPKTIAGIHTHTTPVLLAAGERSELATDQYEQISPTLDGICIVTKKLDSAENK